MSTETTNKKIKIDNGTTFGRTYTDNAVDELLKSVVTGDTIMNATKDSDKVTRTLDTDGKVKFDSKGSIVTLASGYSNSVDITVSLSSIADANTIKANTNIIFDKYQSTADKVFYFDYHINTQGSKFYIGFKSLVGQGDVESAGKVIPVSIPIAWLSGGAGNSSSGVNFNVAITVLQDTDISDIISSGDIATLYLYQYKSSSNTYSMVTTNYKYIKVV